MEYREYTGKDVALEISWKRERISFIIFIIH